jgi:hypothetical protein
VAEGEKFRGLDKSTWWLGDEAEISIDETSEMVWDDEYCNDEDGEYDEEDEEEDEEENGNTPDDIPEQEMTDGIVDYEEEDEEEGEGDVMEEEDDTDSRHPTCTWFGQRKAFNTGYERFPVHHPNVAPVGRTSACEAGRGDFSKSRGFSISNLVHENNGPLTPPGPLMVATGTFYPPPPQQFSRYRYQVDAFYGIASSPPPGPSANGLISPPSTETKKEKSVADLLNPSSPSTGSKRKHSLLSDITPEEKSQEEEEVAHESPENMDETDDDVEEEDKMDSMTKVSTQELAMLFPGKNVQALEEEMETITLEPALPTPDGTSDEEEAIQAGEEEERPRKRARTTRPKKQFAKLAATALAGAIVGGVGVFAALVASAP